MEKIKYFKDLLEPIPDCGKKVLLMFLNKNVNDSLKENGFITNDIKSLNKECKFILSEQNEEYLDCLGNA